MSNLFQEMIETNTVFNTTCARKILRGLFFCLFCFCFEGSHIDFYARRQCQDPVSLVPATFKFASTLVVSSFAEMESSYDFLAVEAGQQSDLGFVCHHPGRRHLIL